MEDLASLTARVTEERRLEECPICMERFPDLWKRHEMSGLYSCCGKRCCKECHDAWLEKGAEAASQCPMCRTAIQFPATDEENFSLTLSRAKAGMAWAQYYAGDFYMDGEGVQAEPTEAVRWYKKASDQGWFEASMILGGCYMDGEGVEKDIKEGRRLLEIAAVSKDAMALYNLSCVLYDSDSPDDKKEMVRLLRLAADQGYPGAQYNFAHSLQFGLGVDQSPREALPLYLKAAEQGHVGAMYNAAVMLLELKGDRAFPKIVFWLRKASSMQGLDSIEEKESQLEAKKSLEEVEATVRSHCARCRKQGSNNVKFDTCVRCKAIYYCSRECQVADWKAQHKKDCVPDDIGDRTLEDRLSFFAS